MGQNLLPCSCARDLNQTSSSANIQKFDQVRRVSPWRARPIGPSVGHLLEEVFSTNPRWPICASLLNSIWSQKGTFNQAVVSGSSSRGLAGPRVKDASLPPMNKYRTTQDRIKENEPQGPSPGVYTPTIETNEKQKLHWPL